MPGQSTGAVPPVPERPPGPVPGGAPGRAWDGDHGRVLRSAGGVGVVTLFSRVSGYLRDFAIAYLLGTGVASDAWLAAFRLPNTLRRLVGEGNVSAAFIPVFTQESGQRSEERLWRLADGFHTAIGLAAGVLTMVGVLVAPWVTRWLLVPGWQDDPDRLELTVELVRIAFPYLVFISLAAVLMAILNARDRFALPAATPILFNLTIVAAAMIGAGLAEPVYAIAVGAVAGGFLQWVLQVPLAWKQGMRFRPTIERTDPALRRIGRLMLPGLFGVGITQVNILVGQAIASALPGGSIASLYFASRLNELTLGVFVMSVAMVVLPLLSRQAAAGEIGAMKATTNFALRQVSLVTLPATAGLVLLRHDIVAVLYQYGRFEEGSTDLTAAALWGYSLGLTAYAVARILAPTFYALEDTRTPVILAAVAMVVNVVGCLLLMGPLAHAGIALASSVAAAVNALLLAVILRRRIGRMGGRRLVVTVARVGVATTAMGALLVAVRPLAPPAELAGAARVAALVGLILLGIVVYAAVLWALRTPELATLRGMLAGRRPPVPPGPTSEGEDG